MGKVIFWIVVVFVVLFALRLMNMRAARRKSGGASRPAVEPMVKCARCGTFVPLAEAKPGPTGLTCGDPVCLSR